MKKDNGNPVSSLDIKEYEIFLIKEGYNKNGAIIKAIMEPLRRFLDQNGVETYKMVPIK